MFNWLKKALSVPGNTGRANRTGVASDEAQTVQPSEYAAHKNSGNEFLAQGMLAEAEECYRQAVAVNPSYAEGYLNLGFVLREQKLYEDAERYLKQAILINPAMEDSYYLLGGVLQERGNLAGAIENYNKAIELKPDFEIVYHDLCYVLILSGQYASAKRIVEKGLSLYPESGELHCFQGNLHIYDRRPDKAIACYQSALSYLPNDVMLYCNMGKAFFNQGTVDIAAKWYRKALALDPDSAEANSCLLFIHSFQPNYSPAEYLADAQHYGGKVLAQAQPYTHWPAQQAGGDIQPLRVGLVSGDLKNHPVGFFLESILAHLNGTRTELVAYSTQPKEDDLTARIKPRFAAWNSIADMSDEAAARKIHDDGIHILIDLAGFTSHNRLPVFAWKPAPVQVSWLGYLASTGMPGMDFVLASPVSVPESHRQHFSENVWYLPDTANCLTPPAPSAKLALTPPPAIRNGYVTFGSFQSLIKINDDVLALWGQIFQALPQARLRFHSKQMNIPASREQFLQRLDHHGIPPERVMIEGLVPSWEDYLATHSEVDIILDSFPYTGITTTCEALWMGVPTVTLAGNTMLARQGASLLTCAGLEEWIANTEEDYIALAVAHASDVTRLAQLRSGLRQKVLASPLFDAPRFARNLEAALQGMWRHSHSFDSPSHNV